MNLIVQVDSIDSSIFSCWIVRVGCHKRLLAEILSTHSSFSSQREKTEESTPIYMIE
jgi:hypothetical protein